MTTHRVLIQLTATKKKTIIFSPSEYFSGASASLCNGSQHQCHKHVVQSKDKLSFANVSAQYKWAKSFFEKAAEAEKKFNKNS
jgi:hypothetical protein